VRDVKLYLVVELSERGGAEENGRGERAAMAVFVKLPACCCVLLVLVPASRIVLPIERDGAATGSIVTVLLPEALFPQVRGTRNTEHASARAHPARSRYSNMTPLDKTRKPATRKGGTYNTAV